MLKRVLLGLLISLSITSPIQIPIVLDGEVDVISSEGGLAPAQTAARFCETYNYLGSEACEASVVQRLVDKMDRSYGIARTRVAYNGMELDVSGESWKDPNTIAREWCQFMAVSESQACAYRLAAELWESLLQLHWQRLASLLSIAPGTWKDALDKPARWVLDLPSRNFSNEESQLLGGTVAVMRSAVRSNPNEAKFVALLLIAEGCFGDFSRVTKRCQRLIELRSTVPLCQDFLKAHPPQTPPHIEHRRESLPQFDITDVKAAQSKPAALIKNTSTFAKAVRGEVPFIVRGTSIRSTSSGEFLNRLRHHFSSSRVEWFPAGISQLNDFRPTHLSLGSAIDQLEAPQGYFYETDISMKGSYIHWSVPPQLWPELLRDAFAIDGMRENESDPSSVTEGEQRVLPHPWSGQFEWLHRCFSTHAQSSWDPFTILSGFSRWFAVYIGGEGSGMFNHVDRHNTAAWQAQLFGRKQWHLCPPSQSELMYGRGGVDVFAPDYESTPLFRQAECFEGVVGPGEMIYYPPGWWHSTRTLECPAISISSLIVSSNHWENFLTALQNDCLGSAPDSQLDSKICEILSGCWGS